MGFGGGAAFTRRVRGAGVLVQVAGVVHSNHRLPLPSVTRDGLCFADFFWTEPSWTTYTGDTAHDQTRFQLLCRPRDASPRGAGGLGPGADRLSGQGLRD